MDSGPLTFTSWSNAVTTRVVAQPFGVSQQPLVRAVLVPVLTYGATAGLQYLHIGG